jgi:sugar lactone lactonase YvrE
MPPTRSLAARRAVPLVLTGLLGTAPSVAAQATVPPDTVSTVEPTTPLDGFGSLGGVTVDALGFVYVANFRDGVWRISPDGEAKRLTDALYGSSGNAVDARGVLHQANFNGNTIVRVSRGGEVETFVDEGLNGPVGLTFGPDGTLYVSNCSGNTISRVGDDGSVDTFADGPLFNCPNGITIDEAGNLYVVNFNSPDVVRITPDGSAERFAQVTGAGGNGHIAFTGGSFYITQFRGHSIWRVSRAGEVSRVAGDGTREILDGTVETARFSFPNGIAAAPGGRVLWVNDLDGTAGSGERTAIRLRRIRIVTLGDVVTEAVAASPDPAGAAEAAYQAYRAARRGQETLTDAIQSGYRLLTNGQVAAGMALFRLNATDHPDVAAARFHLGEAYRFTGRPEDAAEHYRATLELDPDHAQARSRLAALSGEVRRP